MSRYPFSRALRQDASASSGVSRKVPMPAMGISTPLLRVNFNCSFMVFPPKPAKRRGILAFKNTPPERKTEVSFG